MNNMKYVQINGTEHKIIHSVKPHGETKKECKNLDFVEDYYLDSYLEYRYENCY